jgi:polysaccharide biosynthesis protein PelF
VSQTTSEAPEHETRPTGRRRVPGRPRVLLTTEGTYPYETGGVSSWCDLLLRELTDFEWQVLPIVGPHGREPTFVLPGHARQVGLIEVWSDSVPPGSTSRVQRRFAAALPAALVRSLIAWDGSIDDAVAALTWCRRFPAAVRQGFRSRGGWAGFLAALDGVLGERVAEAGVPPALDVVEAAQLYQQLYWIARTAAAPTPPSDVLLATAAGWSAVPALVHKALYGTPFALAEHGVFVRESYLLAADRALSPGGRFAATRLARGLARTAYAQADVVAPVTRAHVAWERTLGLDPDRIVVVHNGLRLPAEPTPLPGSRTVVSVGRIDPLKDVHTMLQVAAETLRHVPEARFLHYGPVATGQEDYGRSCTLLHERLRLGGSFRFQGPTGDPRGVVRSADVALMTSISEGLPLAILEAMSQGRPVVSTCVGGVPEVVRGCGLLAGPGDVHGLAMGLVTLLRDPVLSWRLGWRGYLRLARLFGESRCTDGYRLLLGDLAAASGNWAA